MERGLSDHDAALNLLTMARERLAAVLAFEKPRLMLIAPKMICDSAVSLACALLRVRGITIESNADPHAELCDRLAATWELEYLNGRCLMRDVGNWEAWPDQTTGLDLARRSLDFMISAAVILQTELPEAAWEVFDEQIRALVKRLGMSKGEEGNE
jgi:hypothetical protein